MCAIMVLVAAVPLALADTHYVPKGDQGPRASAVTWEYAPTSYGKWTGHIVNNGLRSLTVDVYDVTTGVPDQVMHQRIRFAAYDAYPTGVVDTGSVIMGLNHIYSITVTPSGPKGSSCTVDDWFMPPPPNVVAVITILSVEDLTVVVDGAMSYDPDGAIVLYDWDLGDGTSATGLTVTHTYPMEGTYAITLTVTDNLGLTSRDSDTVTVFWHPHWASFTCMVDGLTVYVDASASMSDYGIVSYDWDWGDGTTGTGMTATHTYGGAKSATISTESFYSGRVPSGFIHPVFGYTYFYDGVTPMNASFLKFTNVRTGESFTYQQEPGSNTYVVDATMFVSNGYMDGDIVNVSATASISIGWSEYAINLSNGFDGPWDVVLSTVFGPTPPHAIIGCTFGPDGATPMNDCILRFTNLRTMDFCTILDEPGTNFYVGDALLFWPAIPMNGDIINITATAGTYIGWCEHAIDYSQDFQGPWDVILHSTEVSFTVTITLTVTDAFGQTSSVSKEVQLNS